MVKELPPSAASMIMALRAFGYTPESAIADIIDNSIKANARNIDFQTYDGGIDKEKNYVSICDDGNGLNESEIIEKAMPWGTKDELREEKDLGKFGFGLKSASLSQCKKLTVISKGSLGKIKHYTWDVDHVQAHDKWEITDDYSDSFQPHFNRLDKMKSGTVILWQNLDRLYEAENYDKKWQHRILGKVRNKAKAHISMIFHKYADEINFTLQGNLFPIKPWSPFYENHMHTIASPAQKIQYKDSTTYVQSFILPEEKYFLDEENFKGPTGNSTDRQGIYVYRKKRLIVPGGWHNITSTRNKPIVGKEKYNRLRIMVDYDGKNDNDWRLDVKKDSVIIPGYVSNQLSSIVAHQLDKLQKENYKVKPIKKQGTVTPWQIVNNYGKMSAKIDRQNELVKKIMDSEKLNRNEFEKFMKVIETTIPLENIDFNNHILNDDDTLKENN